MNFAISLSALLCTAAIVEVSGSLGMIIESSFDLVVPKSYMQLKSS